MLHQKVVVQTGDITGLRSRFRCVFVVAECGVVDLRVSSGDELR